MLRSVNVGRTPRVVGQLRSTPNSTFTIDFYASAESKQIGTFFVAEGERWVGSIVVITNEFGDAAFSTEVADVVLGEFVTATATNNSNSTSEFSSPVLVRGRGRKTITPPPRPGRAASTKEDDEAALVAIMAEWTSGRSVSEQVVDLGSGETSHTQSTTYEVVRTTEGETSMVRDDGQPDLITGLSSSDWFFAKLGEDITDEEVGDGLPDDVSALL